MKYPENNVLILTYWSYNDALIQTYTLPYAKIIAEILPDNNKIFLLTLDKSKTNHTNNERKIHNISVQYYSFGFRGLYMWIKTLFKLILLIKQERITTIHAWCTPAGMLGYLLSILTGKSLIIDSYEPHAEAMVENGTWKKNGFAFKLLFQFEKLQTKRAKYLIAAAEGMKSYAKEKFDHQRNNFFIKPACVNLELFSEKKLKDQKLLIKLNLQNKLVCVYAGKFGGIYLDKEAFDFFKAAENYWGEEFRVLILSYHSKEEIDQLRIQSGLKQETIILKFIPHSEIALYIGLGDFAITPVKPVPTKKYCTPIKDGEYWALGLPVVITKNISDDSDIIKSTNTGSVLEELNEVAYLKSIKEIDELLKKNNRMELYKKIRPIAERYRNYELANTIYKKIYGGI